MAGKSVRLQLSEEAASPPEHTRTPNRLHKVAKEKTKSPRHLGVKFKRISNYEPYSNRSRGTLGGFLPLCDVGPTDSDAQSGEKVIFGDRECVLTQLTKKIGLGIYTRAQEVTTKSKDRLGDGYIIGDGDERETWYMFYPPPPSPSLNLRPEDEDSAISSDLESEPKSPPMPNIISDAESVNEPDSYPSASSQGSVYDVSRPTSLDPQIDVEDHTVDLDAILLSAEHLADEYRDLLKSAQPIPLPYSSHTPTPRPTQAFSIQIPALVSAQVSTPKTIRKVKRQHSLRKLLDDGESRELCYLYCDEESYRKPLSGRSTLIASPPSPKTSITPPPSVPFVFPFSPKPPLSSSSPPLILINAPTSPSPLHLQSKKSYIDRRSSKSAPPGTTRLIHPALPVQLPSSPEVENDVDDDNDLFRPSSEMERQWDDTFRRVWGENRLNIGDLNASIWKWDVDRSSPIRERETRKEKKRGTERYGIVGIADEQGLAGGWV